MSIKSRRITVAAAEQVIMNGICIAPVLVVTQAAEMIKVATHKNVADICSHDRQRNNGLKTWAHF